jgi:predicted AAA+ superfamily ATPase
LIGFELLPFEKTKKRKATTKSKFFFFDTGVANFLARKLPMTENHSDIGTSFEQFVIQEVRAYLSYFRKDKKLTYWRAKDCEVDLLIGSDCAIEIKFSEKVQDRHFTGLRALAEEKLIKQYFLVGRFEHSGVNEGIEYLHYQDFLKRLWNHQLIKD